MKNKNFWKKLFRESKTSPLLKPQKKTFINLKTFMLLDLTRRPPDLKKAVKKGEVDTLI